MHTIYYALHTQQKFKTLLLLFLDLSFFKLRSLNLPIRRSLRKIQTRRVLFRTFFYLILRFLVQK